jgi:hypothetical protein
MRIQERYTWEAEMADGRIVTEGGDLVGCVRFSLRPVNGVNLPAHDIVGVEMIRRFGRSFKRVRFNDQDDVPGKLFWKNGSDIVETHEDLREFFKQGDLVRQRGPVEMIGWHGILMVTDSRIIIDRPFEGKTANCPSLRHTPTENFEYLHCVVCKGFRLYVRSSDGTALVTPEDFELYL